MRGTVVRGIGAVVALVLVGCSTFQPRTLRIDSAAGTYRGVTLTYRIDGGVLSEPLTVARIVDGQLKQERLASSPYPDRSIVRLSIRYPHPDGKADAALAEMVVETRTPPKPQVKKAVWQEWSDSVATAARDFLPGIKLGDDIHEAWALDIAKSDLDRVVAGLKHSGYFANPSKQTLGIELAVRIDNFQAIKKWSREPELEILMERMRQEGQLVSYIRPPETRSPAILIPTNSNVNGAVLVAQQTGPELVPAGPQNNAYQRPPETAPPQSLPAPAAVPPAAAPSYRAAPAYAPTPSYNPPSAYTPSAPPANNRTPQGRYGQPSMRGTQPQARYPQGPGQPNAGQPSAAQPNTDPRKRWQYPPQYRRQGMTPNQAGSNAMGLNGAGPNGVGPNNPTSQTPPNMRSRTAPQQRSPRMPWQRPAPSQANGQQADLSQTQLPPANQDPRRQRMQRYPGATGQQPGPQTAPNGRFPGRLQRPANNPRQATPYSANSQNAAPPAMTMPDGVPQPPQLNSVPARY